MLSHAVLGRLPILGLPGSSVVGTMFSLQGAWVQLLVRELTYMVKSLKNFFFNSKIKISIIWFEKTLV